MPARPIPASVHGSHAGVPELSAGSRTNTSGGKAPGTGKSGAGGLTTASSDAWRVSPGGPVVPRSGSRLATATTETSAVSAIATATVPVLRGCCSAGRVVVALRERILPFAPSEPAPGHGAGVPCPR